MKISAALLALALLPAAGPGLPAAAQETAEPAAAATGEEKPGEEEPGEEAAGEEAAEAEAAEPEPDPSQPGEHHEHLGALVGDWEFTMRVWTTPGGEPAETTGTIEARWTLGGRFVDAVYRGQMLGQAFEGRRIDGYDNLDKKYQSVWQDDLATYTLFYRGECSEDGKVRTMQTQFQHPGSDVKLINKGVTTLLDDGTLRYESFIVTAGGDEFKNMELEARRRTAPAG